jgi:hypothetical protein
MATLSKFVATSHVGPRSTTRRPTYGLTPLGWAVIYNQQEVVDYLLDAGADPSARFRDRNTAPHSAAFFGRAGVVARLLDAGAEVNPRNVHNETPLDSMRHGQRMTEFIADLLQLPIYFDAVLEGRKRI